MQVTSAKLKMTATLGPLVSMLSSLEKEKVESNKWTANWVSDHYETRLDVDLHNQ